MMKKFAIISLSMIFVFGAILRLLPTALSNFKYPLGTNDGVFHTIMVEYFLEKGHITKEQPFWSPLYDVIYGDFKGDFLNPPGFYLLAAFFVKVTGLSAMQIASIEPALMSAFSIASIYLLVKCLTGDYLTSLTASFVIAIFFGGYDFSPFTGLWLTICGMSLAPLVLYFGYMSLTKNNIKIEIVLLIGILVGGQMLFHWTDTILAFLILLAFAAVQFIRKQLKKNHLISFILSFSLGLAIISFHIPTAWNYHLYPLITGRLSGGEIKFIGLFESLQITAVFVTITSLAGLAYLIYLYFSLNNKDKRNSVIFLLIWVFLMLPIAHLHLIGVKTGWMRLFYFYSAQVLAVLIGLSLALAIAAAKAQRKISNVMGRMLVFLNILSISFMCYSAIDLSLYVKPKLDDDKYNALIWIRQNTPINSTLSAFFEDFYSWESIAKRKRSYVSLRDVLQRENGDLSFILPEKLQTDYWIFSRQDILVQFFELYGYEKIYWNPSVIILKKST